MAFRFRGFWAQRISVHTSTQPRRCPPVHSLPRRPLRLIEQLSVFYRLQMAPKKAPASAKTARKSTAAKSGVEKPAPVKKLPSARAQKPKGCENCKKAKKSGAPPMRANVEASHIPFLISSDAADALTPLMRHTTLVICR